MMATTAKRPGKKTTSRRKTAKKAATKKVAKTARRGAAGKTAQQRKAAPKRRPATKAAAGARASQSAGSTKAAKKSKLAAGTKTAASRRKPVPATKTRRRMSPQAKKNLVAKHLREMLDEKNRRAAQTPAWQQIVHHDHPAPVNTPRVPDAVETVPAEEPGPVATDDGSRDRGES